MGKAKHEQKKDVNIYLCMYLIMCVIVDTIKNVYFYIRTTHFNVKIHQISPFSTFDCEYDIFYSPWEQILTQ